MGFGLRLKQARARPGGVDVTHDAIATAAGVSRVAVTKWEGSANPAIKPDNLFKAADYLGVRARWLATEKGPMPARLPTDAERIAEDWATLPVEYQAAIRKHLDDLLAAIAILPGLRRPIGDAVVEKHIKPAPTRATDNRQKRRRREPLLGKRPSPAGRARISRPDDGTIS